MKKSEKRLRGRIKFERDLEETRQSGLAAIAAAHKSRAEKQQSALEKYVRREHDRMLEEDHKDNPDHDCVDAGCYDVGEAGEGCGS